MGDGDVLYMRKEKSCDDESPTNDDSIWDDTALIEAYDHAVNLAKSEVENRMNGYPDGQYASSSESSVSPPKHSLNLTKKSKHPKGPGPKKVWQVGDWCRSSYSADGILYEASILGLGENGSCLVRYVGYNNEEQVLLNDLLPSRGRSSRHQQEMTANQEETSETTQIPKQHHRKESPSVRHKMEWDQPTRHQSSRPTSTQGMDFSLPHLGMPQMMVPPPPPLNLLAASGCPSDESEALSAMLMSWYMSGFHTGYYQGMKQANTQTSRTPSRRK